MRGRVLMAPRGEISLLYSIPRFASQESPSQGVVRDCLWLDGRDYRYLGNLFACWYLKFLFLGGVVLGIYCICLK